MFFITVFFAYIFICEILEILYNEEKTYTRGGSKRINKENGDSKKVLKKLELADTLSEANLPPGNETSGHQKWR